MPKSIEIFLQPGEYFVGRTDYRIRTVLGSCVSMTLWSPTQRIGAMSHFLLGSRGGPSGGLPIQLDAKYGDEALVLMLHELERMKVHPRQCQAKIFGGSDMFPNQKRGGTLAVGRRNGEAARGLLLANGIEVTSECLFGEGHRQIIFDIGSGDVWCRQVAPLPQLASAEGPFR